MDGPCQEKISIIGFSPGAAPGMNQWFTIPGAGGSPSGIAWALLRGLRGGRPHPRSGLRLRRLPDRLEPILIIRRSRGPREPHVLRLLCQEGADPSGNVVRAPLEEPCQEPKPAVE